MLKSLIIKFKNWYQRFYSRIFDKWEYINEGIWRDTRNIWWVNIVKTLNLSVRSFFDTDLQSQACAMAFRTMLAIVPALALLFAIGRGFGIQTLLQDELYRIFPAQHQAIEQALEFADSYISSTGEGIFLGIGIAFLLWTLISLVSNVEDSFNRIWDIKHGRSIWRKITDYTAMLLILPVLMICAGGLTLFVSTSLQQLFHFPFMTPIISMILESASWLLTWLFFTAAFILIPNTKVNKTNAFIAGIISGTGFRLLQWLFVTGQIYVTRYNAIYGSFAFLPLLLIWMQLTWVVTLSGSLICYASQNIFQYSFQSEIDRISTSYRRKVSIAIAAAVTKNYSAGLPAPTPLSLSVAYSIPMRLMTQVLNQLIDAGILVRVFKPDVNDESYALQPAIDPKLLSVDYVYKKLETFGRNDFINNFDKDFVGITQLSSSINEAISSRTSQILLSDLNITPEDIALKRSEDSNHISNHKRKIIKH